MYCISCGKHNDGFEPFCHYCGASQAPAAQAQRQHTAPAAVPPAPVNAPAPYPAAPVNAPPLPPAAPANTSTPYPASPFVRRTPSPGEGHVFTSSNVRRGRQPRPARKTAADIVSGILFLPFGLAAFASFAMLFGNSAAVYNELFYGAALSDFFISLWDPAASPLSLPWLLTAAGSICAAAGGLLMLASGIVSLFSGGGGKTACAALVLMLFTLVFDVANLLLLFAFAKLPFPTLGETVLGSLLVYLLEVLCAALLILMPLLKKRARTKTAPRAAYGA